MYFTIGFKNKFLYQKERERESDERIDVAENTEEE